MSDLRTVTAGSSGPSPTWTTEQAATEGATAAALRDRAVDAVPPTVTNAAPAFEPARPSLPPPGLDGADIGSVVLLLRTVLSQEQTKASQADIRAEQTAMKALNKERAAELEKFAETIKKSNTSSIIGKVFGWLSSFAMVAAGIITIAIGVATAATGVGILVGVVAGGAMIASGMVGLTMATLDQTGAMEKMTEGLGAALAKELRTFGMGDEADQVGKLLAGITIGVTVAAVQLALAATTVVVTLGAGGAAAVTAAMQACSTIFNVCSGIASAGLGLGGAATQAATAAFNHQAGTAMANSLDAKRLIGHAQTMMEGEMGRLEEILRKIDQSTQTVVEMIANTTDTRAAHARQMA